MVLIIKTKRKKSISFAFDIFRKEWKKKINKNKYLISSHDAWLVANSIHPSVDEWVYYKLTRDREKKSQNK